MEGLKRIKANTIEKRLQKPSGDPSFNIVFYVLNARGDHAGVAMYGDKDLSYAVCTERGPQTLRCEPLLQGVSTE
jgi:hypothetical protein